MSENWEDCPACMGSGKINPKWTRGIIDRLKQQPAVAAGAGQGAFYAEKTYPPGCCQWCGSREMKPALLAWMERLKEGVDAELKCPDCGFVYAPSKFAPDFHK